MDNEPFWESFLWKVDYIISECINSNYTKCTAFYLSLDISDDSDSDSGVDLDHSIASNADDSDQSYVLNHHLVCRNGLNVQIRS